MALPLKLLADECFLEKLLVAKLKGAGHDVCTVTELGLTGKSDHAVFEAAIATDRMVITNNCIDFVVLAQAKVAAKGSHPGVLLVYRQNVPSKEMTHEAILKAIENLHATGLELINGCHKLNDYSY